MEASKRVRVSEGFTCDLLVLSALPSYKHANRHGIPDKKRAATEYSAEPHVRISAATLDAGAKFPKGKHNLHTPRHACACTTRSCQMLFEYIREGHAGFWRLSVFAVGYSTDAISKSRWGQRPGNFFFLPKEPPSDGSLRTIVHFTY